jgi:ectoine hydroxylase-related dioxygenase (phytanoyl-CoA dioxygenase family)
MCRENRFDVLLPLDKLVLRISKQILRHLAPLVIEVSGDTSSLCELSCIVSDPGSPAQPVHHDTQFDGSFPRFSVLVPLQETTKEMGPTGLFPHTNTPDWHLAYALRAEELECLFEDTPHVLATLGAGDALIYDTNSLHFGSANVSDTRRSVLALSFQIDKGVSAGIHSNIMKGYRNRYPVADFETWGVHADAKS